MRHLFSNTADHAPDFNGANYFLTKGYDSKTASADRDIQLEPGMAYQMATGRIPDLRSFCLEMAEMLNQADELSSAKQFLPVLQKLPVLKPEQIRQFIKHPETRHVLMSGDQFEVVLIHWKPGKASNVHGHSFGGCVFKLLQGKLEELRYTPERSPRLLSMNSMSSGEMAYIDDSMAYHQVGNPYGSSAISIHVYIK
jgi:predicted metal-dependent enzyme (double-stranded beta helix superfamily)